MVLAVISACTQKSRKELLEAITNLSRLINDLEVKRISVSGEGEPLNNIHIFYQILALSKGNRQFEFITSGYLEHEKLKSAFREIDRIVETNGDQCNIRLSSDSHHIPKLKHLPHGKCIDDFKEGTYNNLTLSFRSIDPDREFTRRYLIDQAKVRSIGALEDVVEVDGTEFRIDYKSLVKPHGMYEQYMSMWQYIDSIEQKTGKPFTLGREIELLKIPAYLRCELEQKFTCLNDFFIQKSLFDEFYSFLAFEFAPNSGENMLCSTNQA